MQKFINKKYDFIFSLGEACACTQVLRKCRLQFASYPFDWLFGSTFLNRIKLLCFDVDNFINKSDLVYSYEEKNIACSAYYNKSTDITFNHDFPKDLSLDESFEQVKSKYDRRINRLLNCIEKSESVLVVYLQTPSNPQKLTVDELLEAYNTLRERFGHKINLLYLYCQRGIDYKNKKVDYITDNIVRVVFDYDGYNEELPYVVNFKKLYKVFNKFKISSKFLTFKNLRSRLVYRLLTTIKGLFGY